MKKHLGGFCGLMTTPITPIGGNWSSGFLKNLYIPLPHAISKVKNFPKWKSHPKNPYPLRPLCEIFFLAWGHFGTFGETESGQYRGNSGKCSSQCSPPPWGCASPSSLVNAASKGESLCTQFCSGPTCLRPCKVFDMAEMMESLKNCL